MGEEMNYRSSLLFLFRILAATFTFVACLQANRIQERYCRAALNLGYAEARLSSFGRLMNGQIPVDQEVSVELNLANAAAEIRAAMAIEEVPYRSDGLRNEAGRLLLNQLDDFSQRTEGRNHTQRAAMINGLRATFRSLLSVTFVSSRSDAVRAESNCDTFVVDSCYHYGRATIIASFDDRVSSERRGAALGSMRLAIREGLAIAMDLNGHLPFDGHRMKECCTFGTPEEWAPFLALRPSNPVGTFAGNTGELLRIIRDANLLDPVCSESNVNPWDRAADEGHELTEEQERRTRELVDALIARGENALNRCDFLALDEILSQLAALAPGDPRYQSLRARAARLREREQEGLGLLREAGSYADLNQTVQLLKQAQEAFPCPKPEVNQVISSAIREAADQQRGATVERSRARRTAWTSTLEGLIDVLEEASATQSGGGTLGTGGTTGGAGAGGGTSGRTGQTISQCNCDNLNYGRSTNHAVSRIQDIKCAPISGARLTKADLHTGLRPFIRFTCEYEPTPDISSYTTRLRAEWWSGAGNLLFLNSSKWIGRNASRNAAVGYGGNQYPRLPPAYCQDMCRAGWDLLRQVEQFSGARRQR
jgi:hypothetical protein